jgi:hypothetical protein
MNFQQFEWIRRNTNMTTRKSIRTIALAGTMLCLPPGAVNAAATCPCPGAAPGNSEATIAVAYMLDPSLTASLYMGERWVSPTRFTVVQAGNSASVKASAQVPAGSPPASWIPGSAMVSVTPSSGNLVEITISGVGASTLDLVTDGASKHLAIHAVHLGNSLKVDITQ